MIDRVTYVDKTSSGWSPSRGPMVVVMSVLGFGLAACGRDIGPDNCAVAPVLAVLANRCSNAGCHVPGGQYPELTAKGIPQWIDQMSHEAPSERLIVPGDPDGSWVYRKLTGGQSLVGSAGGALMPLGASMPIEEASVIHDWIAAGAPVDCSGTSGSAAPTDPNTLDQGQLFTCKAQTPGSSIARVRRIDQVEWAHAISTKASPTNPFTNQSGAPYSTYALGQTVDTAILDLYFGNLSQSAIAWDKADTRVDRIYPVYYDVTMRCIFNDAKPSDSCIDYYVDRLLTVGVLSRAPSDGERARFRAYVVAALGGEPGGGDASVRQATLDDVISTAWLMSGALFRSEIGAPVADDPMGRRRLTNDELALALGSILNTHRPGSPVVLGYTPPAPDDMTPASGWLQQVRAAADDGTIQDPDVLRALLAANSGGIDPARKDTLFEYGANDVLARGEYWLAPRIAGFFREWLDYEAALTAFKDTVTATTGFAPGAADYSYLNLQSGYFGYDSTLVEQLDDTIARAVIESASSHTDVFKALMTTTMWRLPSDYEPSNGQACHTGADCTDPVYPVCITQLGVCGNESSPGEEAVDAVYNLVGVPNTPSGRWVSMNPAERSGVLTHPAWLSAHGNNLEDDASLVHRGKWIRQNLFCETVPGLENVQVQAMLGGHDPAMSARDRVVAATTMGANSTTCMGCHGMMNTLGFPFEIYNHAGFLRVTDHGHAPDGTTMVTNAPDAALNGSFTSAIDFTQSLGASPYARRCFIRQAFRYFMGRDERMEDSCTLTAMESALDNGSFFDMLSALVTSDTFLYRTIAEGGDR